MNAPPDMLAGASQALLSILRARRCVMAGWGKRGNKRTEDRMGKKERKGEAATFTIFHEAARLVRSLAAKEGK